MYVLYGSIDLFLPASSSLKDKRQTIQSISGSLRKRCNISITEVEHHDLWQRSKLGFAASCRVYADASRILNIIIDTLEKYEEVCEVIDFYEQIISV